MTQSEIIALANDPLAQGLGGIVKKVTFAKRENE